MNKLWLYLSFPQLQLDSLLQQSTSEQSLHKENSQKPWVIWHEEKHQICQLNQTAYQAGIRVGMGLGTAAMLKHDIEVVLYQEKISQGMLSDIAHQLYLISSDISFWGSTGLLLQAHNMLTMYGGLPQYWQMIQQHIPNAITYHYASGHSPLAARLLATTKWNTITDDHSSIQQAIQPLSLQHTELSSAVVKKLARVGLHTLHDLLKIPFADLAKRFDADVTHYIGQLTNQISHPIHCFHPKQTFERYLELLFDIENLQTLLKPLKILLTALASFLKSRDLLTHTLHIKLYLRDTPSVDIKVESRQGEYQMDVWLSLITLKFENLSLSSPAYAISLKVDNTFVRSPDKQDLFSRKQGTFSRLQLQSLLQAKLGDDALTTPQLSNDFRPELMLNNTLTNMSSNQAIHLQPMRPSFLLSKPAPLQEKVSIAYGPERIHTAWWDQDTVIRDYFIAYNSIGQWYWIYKTPDNQWYLHGIFS
ncbi:DNA polymerase Y family protein [Paraglaciecola aquimarina]|uniref:DNA polymerase Y family protein n=1 Tax=Paraglaciecola algarum TaxID=3050085 RepID=A0ABS9D1N4_9ALTE|nr:DNA polymerase Y family protein [Paraglaciecola sp. G1-23]MCF2946534.1 DNA polymerase Y family protein [Paraglaciecola sp. G1-23]